MDALAERRVVARALQISLVDAALCAVMVGVSESYFGALAVQLGHQDTALALLATVPLLCAAFAQLGAGFLSDLLGSRKRLVVAAVALQAASHLAFLAIAITGEQGLAALMAAKVLFWVSGSVAAPAWSAWMAALTQKIFRERYFAWRSALVQVVILVTFTGAGLYLAAAHEAGAALRGFAILHAVALVARALSAVALGLQGDLPAEVGAGAPAQRTNRGAFRARLRLAVSTGRWRVALTMSLLMFGGHIAIPFFTPYMLRTLELDLDRFALLISVSVLTKALTFPLWHRVTGRIGLAPVLFGSGLGVALVAYLWAVATTFDALVVAQLVSGVAWGGFEFASFQLLLQSAKEDCRLEFLSLASCLTGVLQLAGALCGGYIIEAFALDYRQVFVISSIARALPLLLLLTEIRTLVRLQTIKVFWRMLSVRPSGGLVGRPLLGVFPPPPEDDVDALGAPPADQGPAGDPAGGPDRPTAADPADGLTRGAPR